MRVYLGSDHAGFDLKQYLIGKLRERGDDPVDVGPATLDPEDDYPPFCLHAAARVVGDPGSLGIVIGGSGNGEQIAANKVPGVRAALAWNDVTARLARQHNDANVVALGARMHSADQAWQITLAFLDTPFSGEPRHRRRIDQVMAYERERTLPVLPSA
ncbi:MAG: ribose-5-phosphate isomerase [Candidatus Rokubacteria bacterium]|nr:ribose-5-phosphate isomerase [Candidatus Rokubacteria bacterium]